MTIKNTTNFFPLFYENRENEKTLSSLELLKPIFRDLGLLI